MRNASILAAVMTVAVTLAPLAALAQAGPNNYPPKTTPATPSTSHERCEDDLGFLYQVYAAEIEEMDDDWRVDIRPICEGTHTVALKSLGNATHLRGTLGRNDWLVANLDEADYRADDVIGIRLGTNETVTLFVHHSEY